MTRWSLVGIATGLVIIGIAAAVWRCRGATDDARSAPAVTRDRSGIDDGATNVRPGAVEGMVTEHGGPPIKGAWVCAVGDRTREPMCTRSDPNGRYVLTLAAGEYRVSATARTFLPASSPPVVVAAERRARVDLALDGGAVEVTGTVVDITGGPVGNARVWVVDRTDDLAPPGFTEADASGKFSLWMTAGEHTLGALAEGYTRGMEAVIAPGHATIVLTPAATLAGTVVDGATGAPIAGARVELSGDWLPERDRVTTSASDGTFALDHLRPGRYAGTATSATAFGRSDRSVLVGLAQHADGMVIRMWPAFRVEGRVVIAATNEDCPQATVIVRDDARGFYETAHHRSDGTFYLHGLTAGTYVVAVTCPGRSPRANYDPIVIHDRDALDLVWPLDEGATIRGRVVRKSGAVVAGARVVAKSKVGWGDCTSDSAGQFVISGLRAGSYQLAGYPSEGLIGADEHTLELEVGERTVNVTDVVLDDIGAIDGVVIEPDGHPVDHVAVKLLSLDSQQTFEVRTDDAGRFAFREVMPANYFLAVYRNQDRLTKNERELVTVESGKTAHPRLVVESHTGTIKGTVVDARGAPIGDAYVIAAREFADTTPGQLRWEWDDRAVMTNTEGKFTLERLPLGLHSVRAFRRGGGDAIVEHAKPDGPPLRIAILPTASIAGTVRSIGELPHQIELAYFERHSSLARGEMLWHSDGNYLITDLPAGDYAVYAVAGETSARRTVTIANGEAKTGVDLELRAAVTVTGRIVDEQTHQPLGGIVISGRIDGRLVDSDYEPTGRDGRFALSRVPVGRLVVEVQPTVAALDVAAAAFVRQIDGIGTVNLGDLAVARDSTGSRGQLGATFTDQYGDHVVETVDADGPAARAGLKVGDVVIAIDGADARDDLWYLVRPKLQAPPGTVVALGLARGVTVRITLEEQAR